MFRQGTFADETVGWEGNYVKGKQWATDNPLNTPDYAQKYGLPGENLGKPDWIVGGRVRGDYTTRPAPASHNNPKTLEERLKFYQKTPTMSDLTSSICQIEVKMIPIETAADVYPAVEEIIKRLASHPVSRLAAILDHRMHKVAWTTRDELFEELYKIFTTLSTSEASLFDVELRSQISQLICFIKNHLAL